MSLPPPPSPSIPASPLLQASRLRFGYAGAPPVFDGFSFGIPAGLTLVCGGDGRGKTTLLRLLAGELAPQAGSLSIGGIELAHDPRAYRQQVFRPGSGSEDVAQSTPTEVLAAVRARWPAFDAAALDGLVAGLGLAPHMAKRMFMLSTGSQRKVWLAAAFGARAPVTLVDDPFGALDGASVRFVLDRLRAAAADSTRAFVFSSWDAPEGLPLAAVIDLGD